MPDKYYIKVSKKYAVDPILADFAKWLKDKEYGSVGWFEFIVDKVPDELFDSKKDNSDKIISFFRLPEGSIIALHNGNGSILHFDSESSGSVKIATSLKEFLINLAKAETGIADLDNKKANGRKELQAWLKLKKINALEKTSSKTNSNISYKDFLPALGKSTDSEEVKKLLTQLQTTNTPKKDSYFTLPSQGLTLVFEKNKKALELVCVQIFPISPKNDITHAFEGELPAGLKFSDLQKDAHKKMGKPASSKKQFRIDTWNHENHRLTVEYDKDTMEVGCVMIDML